MTHPEEQTIGEAQDRGDEGEQHRMQLLLTNIQYDMNSIQADILRAFEHLFEVRIKTDLLTRLLNKTGT